MQGNSRTVETTQPGIHDKLEALVARYRTSEHKRPVSAHTQQAFNAFTEWLGDWRGPLIIDSCCGVGKSTATLATRFPDAKVVGLDKSDLRIQKHAHYHNNASNYRVFRADVNDFWRLLRQAQPDAAWQIEQHYLLYPNPYPKSAQVQKRWHSGPAMPDLMAIAPIIEVRSNWLLYLQEFARACELYGKSTRIDRVETTTPITPFEEKYLRSGQDCWVLRSIDANT